MRCCAQKAVLGSRAGGSLPGGAGPVPVRVPAATRCQANRGRRVCEPGLARTAAGAAAGVAASALLLLGSVPGASASQPLQFPVSPNEEVFKVQKTLVEAWTIVTEAFIDNSFNHQEWDRVLSASLADTARASSAEAATEEIGEMLGSLGDPYTRRVPPKEYADFRVGSDGELQGVGLLIASDPASGRLVVLAPISGGPAERAGIRPGDEVLSVDGRPTLGWTGDTAATYLRGRDGSSVWVEVARKHEGGAGADYVPGRAGAAPEGGGAVEHKRFRLTRERLELSPVFGTALHYDSHTFGYLRLVTFSQRAAADMQRAMAQLARDGAEGFILDLRNNPGGLVKASVEVAGLWLDAAAHPTVFEIEDRDGQDSAVPVRLDGASRASSSAPLVLLVNGHSASASEILAGALHDNGRAEVLGERTFGKGKIQSVFELGDGSALFVTVAKYRTPAHTDIDQVGVRPDAACSPLLPGGPPTMPGIPVGPGADEAVIEELGTDACVLSAEVLLEDHVDGLTA